MTPEEENRIFLKDCIDSLELLPTSREEGIENGSILFLHTVGCRNGHVPVRFVSVNRCAVCVRRSRKKTFAINKKKRYKDAVEYQKRRYKDDVKFRAASMLRDSVKRVFRFAKRTKDQKTFDILGFSVDEFIMAISEKFSDGMSWENHGDVWHLDHKIPLSAFDFSNKSHVSYANSIENLEPLFIEDHAKKTNNDVRLLRVFFRTGEIPEEWIALAQLDC